MFKFFTRHNEDDMPLQYLRQIFLILIFSFSVFQNSFANKENEKASTTKSNQQIYKIKTFTKINWNGPITPATTQHFEFGLSQVGENGALVIELNTPGGLVSSMKDILHLVGEAQVPVIVWVNPIGASATSAGAFIAAGAHAVYMSQGSNIGAATPVSISGDIDSNKNNAPANSEQKNPNQNNISADESDTRKKAVNDLTALIRSLANARGHNEEKYAEMVTNAASFEAKEALQMNIIDGIADNKAELEKQLHNQKIQIRGTVFQLEIHQPDWNEVEMNLSAKWLNYLAHPSLTYFLFLLGIAFIYLELQAPGGFIAGSIGALSLLLSGIGFQVLPLNFGGLGLIVLAFILFIIEIYITSFGILTIAGLISLISGSLFLFKTEDSYVQLSHSMIGAAVGSIILFLALIMMTLLKKRPKTKFVFNDLTGKQVTVLKFLEQHGDQYWYQVKINGEIWKACSSYPFSVNDEVIVLAKGKTGLYLDITKKEN